MAALDGVTEVHADHWSVAFKGAQPKASTIAITGKIDFTDQSLPESFRFLKKAAGETLAKMTIPSPSMLHLIACVRTESYTPIERYRMKPCFLKTLPLPTKKRSWPSMTQAAVISS